jgi:hypothetical protein
MNKITIIYLVPWEKILKLNWKIQFNFVVSLIIKAREKDKFGFRRIMIRTYSRIGST